MIVAILITLPGTAFTGWLPEERARISMLPALPQIAAPAHADDDGGQFGGRDEQEGARSARILPPPRNLARAMVAGDKRAPEPGDIA
jgi:hypothetical protein